MTEQAEEDLAQDDPVGQDTGQALREGQVQCQPLALHPAGQGPRDPAHDLDHVERFPGDFEGAEVAAPPLRSHLLFFGTLLAWEGLVPQPGSHGLQGATVLAAQLPFAER